MMGFPTELLPVFVDEEGKGFREYWTALEAGYIHMDPEVRGQRASRSHLL